MERELQANKKNNSQIDMPYILLHFTHESLPPRLFFFWLEEIYFTRFIYTHEKLSSKIGLLVMGLFELDRG